MNYKPNESSAKSGVGTHNTVETFRGTSRKDQIMLSLGNEESKVLSNNWMGKQIRLKKNLKRFSNNNRYKVTLPNGEEDIKAKSHSRNRSKRNVNNVNTSLVVNKSNYRQNFFKGNDSTEQPATTRNQTRKDKNQLLKSLELNSHRVKPQKPMSTKESQPEVKTINNLNESKSEAKTARQKKPSNTIKTLEAGGGKNLKLNQSAVNEINKTLQQLKSCRSPNGSASTNPQAPKTVQSEKPEFPMGAGKALKLFMTKLSDYEKGEILDYRQVYFLGLESKKIMGTPLKSPNYGYDNDKGDYKTVLRDHIAYRYEVLEFLGKGSFGQALKCFDHKTNEYV
jgi:hypothetical protein